ncbi:MAG: HDIG domain-containing protein [Syntrophorhabdaceae bacterium]|nr:HDIG domain-containing protein [Syntrophorhabdaceae bacterium]
MSLMSREEAEVLLKKYIKNEKMLAHCLATEAVMRALAKKLKKDEEKWGLAGLLHDLDVEICNGDLNVHGRETERILRDKGLDEEIIDAIVMHNEQLAGRKRHTEFQHALAAGETITGLIMATTLVYPDKKITSVKSKSVIKRMKEKAFAASVSRENILECEKIGIPLEEFVEISLNAMREIGERIGL